MRSAFSIAAFAMVKSSSDIASECVMPTSASNADAITNTILQCYTDSGISLSSSSFARSFIQSAASSSSSDSDLIIVGSDEGFASTSSDASSTDSGFSTGDTGFSSTGTDFSSFGTDFSMGSSDISGISSDSSAMIASFCASSSCKDMIGIFKELWPTDCTIDGSSLYQLINEVNSVCKWSSDSTTAASAAASLSGSSVLALATTSAAALLLML